MTDDYEDLLAETAKLGRLEIHPAVGIVDDEVWLLYPLGPWTLTVAIRDEGPLGVNLSCGEVEVEGWDSAAEMLCISEDPRARLEWFTEPLETLRRHLEGQVWLLRLLLEMR